MDFLHSGKLGKVYLAKGLCYKPRGSIGTKADAPVPEGVDYNLWLGPAPDRPFNPNRFHYEWHWNWDYGGGDLANQGIHQMDLARWGLNVGLAEHRSSPPAGDTATRTTARRPTPRSPPTSYDDCLLEFEVRGLPTNPEQGMKVGNLYYGTEGVLALNEGHWTTYFGHKNEPGPSGKGGGDHFANFVEAVQSRDRSQAPRRGHRRPPLQRPLPPRQRQLPPGSRSLKFDPAKAETFLSDSEADAMLTREYRSPFSMPDKV